MIYFAQPVDGGPVKIGTTENLPQRLAGLESTYGKPMALLGTMPGGRDEERAIHDRFSHLRLGRTEQFRPEPELMQFIGKPLLTSDISSNVPIPYACRSIIFAMRGSAEFRAWLDEAASACNLSVSALVTQAVIRYVKTCGFTKPAPER